MGWPGKGLHSKRLIYWRMRGAIRRRSWATPAGKQKRRREFLKRALDSLPDRERQIIVERHLQPGRRRR